MGGGRDPVRLPAVDGEEWIELTGLGQALVDSTLSDEVDWRQGWQEVPDEVGYQAPLDVPTPSTRTGR